MNRCKGEGEKEGGEKDRIEDTMMRRGRRELKMRSRKSKNDNHKEIL